MFSKILIANRGEIACRVIRTARAMGIRTVAVHSEADARALHVAMADEAVAIGPAPARESYLRIDRVIDAARRTDAQAVHPGYGFLSENAEFAEACAAAGIVFIGPPVAAIRAMGSKAAAKALMEKAGVPVVPGYHGDAQDERRLADEARRIGYPVLIKAWAGGGGRGMRVVDDPAGLTAALASARREAASAFGDDRVLIEKYLNRPRHIEVQVFGDGSGAVIHLFERDCSIQRRHQKIIEEAPAPGLAPERRRAVGEVAVAAARAVGYVGAGTVEFIAEGEDFYFMEMNTRLQVEHPVTEMITGLDLVEWQLRIAAGQPLPLRQSEVTFRGHAVEARLYAEDPDHDFMPSAGTLLRLRPPADTPGLRIDAGMREGDAITVHYDTLIAKIVAWGEDRPTALRILSSALAAYRIVGPATNRDFLLRLVRHPEMAAAAIDTGFIARHRDALLPPTGSAPPVALAAASLALLLDQAEAARMAGDAAGDPHSPWRRRDGWRLNGNTYQNIRWRDGAIERLVRIQYRGDKFHLDLDGQPCAAWAERDAAGDLVCDLDGVRSTFVVARRAAEVTIVGDAGTWRLVHLDPLAPKAPEAVADERLLAPMPGTIVQVLAAAGDRVRRGQALIVLEAMKMVHTLVAPADGTVDRVHFAPGELVDEGAELVAFSVAESRKS